MGTKVCSLRAIMLVLLIFTYLMNTSYTSVLVSRLTVADFSYHLQSIEEIPSSNAPFLCVRTNSGVYSMFQRNTSSGQMELLPHWKPIVNQGPCYRVPLNTDHVAFNLCQRDCFIFESDNIMSNLLSTGNSDCNMVRLRVQRVFSQVSLLVRKHFQFRKLLQVQIMKLKGSGVLNLLETRFLKLEFRSTNAQGYPVVTISHVKSILVVYGVAIAISLVFLAIEMSVYFRKRSNDLAALKNEEHKNNTFIW